MVAVTGVVEPNMANHRIYGDLYQAYVQAYEGLTRSRAFETLAHIQAG